MIPWELHQVDSCLSRIAQRLVPVTGVMQKLPDESFVRPGESLERAPRKDALVQARQDPRPSTLQEETHRLREIEDSARCVASRFRNLPPRAHGTPTHAPVP